jgi:hypothetical protein
MTMKAFWQNEMTSEGIFMKLNDKWRHFDKMKWRVKAFLWN